MRHSTAVDPYEAPTDESRWLTAAGRARMRVTAPLLGSRLQFTHLFTSPLVRAVQTADLLAEGTGFAGPIQAHAGLAAEYGTTAQALSVLDRLPDNAVVGLVTHAPKVRVLAGHLAGRTQMPGFRTGSACVIDITRDDRRSIAFWLDPEPAQLLDSPPAV